MKLARKVGATSEIWQVFVRDSSSPTGGGLTGLAFNTASLTAYYHRDTDAAATAITLVTMTVGAFTSSGFKEIDATNMPGWYQFCPPNAALATGAKSCCFHLKGAANMAPLPIEVDLDAQVDVTHVSGTAQTARDIGASVLLSSGTGTGQLDFTGGVVKANAVQLLGTAWLAPGTAGTPDVNVRLISGDSTAADNAEAFFDGTGYAGTNNTIPTVTTVGSVSNFGGNALTYITSIYDATYRQLFGSGTVGATGNTTTTVHLATINAAYGTDGITGCLLVVANGDTGDGYARYVTAFNTTTNVATLDAALPFTPSAANLDAWYLYASRRDPNLDAAVSSRLAPTTAGRTLDVSAGGEAGVDWANVGGQGTTVVLTGTTVFGVSSMVNAQVIGMEDDICGNQVIASVAGDVAGKVLGGGAGTITGAGAWALDGSGNAVAPASSALSTSVWTPTKAGFLDAAVTSRMGTYTQPTGFLAATFPATVSSYAGGDTSGTATLLTRLSAARAGYIDNIDNVNLANVPAFPANFSALTISLSGHLGRVTLVDTTTVATSLTNLPTIPANWLTAAGTAADFTTEIQAGLATAASISALNNLSAAQVNAEVDTALADVGLTTTVTGRIDAAVSSRMATYTQPTGFLAATFPGTVASPTNITAASGVALAANQHVIVDSGTVTTLTNLPTAPTDWLTAAAVKADAVTKIQAGLSTYAGGDTAGTTTLLSRVTAAVALAGTAPTWYTAPLTSLGSTAPAGWIDTAAFAAGATLPRVTLVDTTTTNTDMRGTNNALLAASYVAPVDVSANVTAIKAKTDNLPADPIGLADLATAHGTGSYVRNTEPPTAAIVASAVWDEILSGHTTAGSAGAGLTAAGSGGGSGGSGGMTVDTILLTVTTPNSRLVDTNGSPLTTVTVGQALTSLLVALLGDRSGVGTREIVASLPGVPDTTVTASRISRSLIEAAVVVPPHG